MTKKLFLVARYTQVLRNPKNPDRSSAAFMNNESMFLTKNIKRRDLEEAGVILDIANAKVIKNRFNDRPFDELYGYYIKHYSDYINKWLNAQRNS